MRRKTLRHEWTKDDALHALNRYARQLGRTPTLRDLQHLDARLGAVPGEATLRRMFGRLSEAQRLAGCSPNRQWRGSKRQFTREALIAKLRLLASDWLRTPTAREVLRAAVATGRLPNPATYIRYFGSWSGALLAANLTQRPTALRRQWCQRGHSLASALSYGPTRWFPKGYRRCKTCYRIRQEKYKLRAVVASLFASNAGETHPARPIAVGRNAAA